MRNRRHILPQSRGTTPFTRIRHGRPATCSWRPKVLPKREGGRQTSSLSTKWDRLTFWLTVWAFLCPTPRPTFIFPRRVDHGDMREQLPYGQILSGGVLELGPEGFLCSGGNSELGIKARPEEDAAIIAEALRHR